MYVVWIRLKNPLVLQGASINKVTCSVNKIICSVLYVIMLTHVISGLWKDCH